MAIRNRAADLLVAVLYHPQNVVRAAGAIESAEFAKGLAEGEPSEEWDVLTAVATSLRESATRGDRRQPEAEIHLLRHLAARHQ